MPSPRRLRRCFALFLRLALAAALLGSLAAGGLWWYFNPEKWIDARLGEAPLAIGD